MPSVRLILMLWRLTPLLLRPPLLKAMQSSLPTERLPPNTFPTESEHSALSACIGASAAGARVATATSSQGLAYMWEELHIASGMRCPIVMANANRALSAPINIHGDHSDIMSARDCGWGMMFAETAQEALRQHHHRVQGCRRSQCSASGSHHSRWLCYHTLWIAA